MRAVISVEVDKIDYNKPLPRNAKVAQFMTALAGGAHFPPINAERLANGRYKLNGGRHRLAAHIAINKKYIRALVAIREDPRPDKPLVTKDSNGLPS